MPRNNDGISLHVSGFKDNTRPSDLAGVFESYGRIADVYIPKDYYTGAPRGFAYVQYENDEIARRVYQSGDRFMLDGRTLKLEYAQGKRKSPNQMRGRGGDRDRGYHRGRSRSPSRSPERRYRQSSRRYSRSRSRSFSRDRHDRYDHRHRRRDSRSRSRSRSPVRRRRTRSFSRSCSRSRSPFRRRSPSPRGQEPYESAYRSPTPPPPRNRSLSPRDDSLNRPGRDEEAEGYSPLRNRDSPERFP